MTNILTLSKHHEKLIKGNTRDYLQQMQQIGNDIYSTNGHAAHKLSTPTDYDYSIDYNCIKSDQCKNVLEPLFEKYSYDDTNKIWFNTKEIIQFLKAIKTLSSRKETQKVTIKNNTITYINETNTINIVHTLIGGGLREGIEITLNVDYLLQVCELQKDMKNEFINVYYKESFKPVYFEGDRFNQITSIILPIRKDQ
jgi:hypothetical protein